MLGVQSFLSACCLMAAIHQPIHLLVNEPSEATLNQSVTIQIQELDPFSEVELEARTTDQKGEAWTSHAFFQADRDGSVNLTSNQPLPGSSYDSADEMGLFWSMLPASNDPSLSFKCKEDAFIVELTLRQKEKILGKKTITRFLKSPDIKRVDVNENGLVGVLFLPPSTKPLPVIITLSGSNGGISENRAKLLASNGFAVLALGVFGVEGLPPNLQDIPLEYFETAFAWLKDQPQIDSSRVGLYGVSRGAELALILGSYFPDSIQGIVAVVPSSVVYGGLSETPVNAWTYKRKPILPFAPVPQTDFENGIGHTPNKPANTRQSFLEGMKQTEAFEAAAIPVENLRCPLLLVSGGDDQMWPSDVYARQILDRLEKTDSEISRNHLHYPSAGHGINIPNLPIPGPTYYHPIGKRWFSMGGTRATDAAASRDAWNKLVAFFHQTFNQENTIERTGAISKK